MSNVINKVLCFVIGVALTLTGVCAYKFASRVIADNSNQVAIYEVVNGSGEIGKSTVKLVDELEKIKASSKDDAVKKIDDIVKSSGLDAVTTTKDGVDGLSFLVTIKTANNYFYNVEGSINLGK